MYKYFVNADTNEIGTVNIGKWNIVTNEFWQEKYRRNEYVYRAELWCR